MLTNKKKSFSQLDFLKMLARMTTIQYQGGAMPDTFKVFTTAGIYVFKADKEAVQFIPKT